MTLDSGLRRNDVQRIMLCPDILEHRLFEFHSQVGSGPPGTVGSGSARI